MTNQISNGQLLWTPADDAAASGQLADFATALKDRHGFDWQGDFQALWRWSVDHDLAFWDLVWDWHGVIGEKGQRLIENDGAMPGACFFPDAQINYAENMLADADNRLAISAHCEDGRHVQLTRAELKAQVMQLAGWMQAAGIGKGDRVAAYIPNIPESIIAMLATATLGGIFSSCSPDFGLGGVSDRFGQIEPKLLIACDGYHYAGKTFDRMAILRDLAAALPSVTHMLVIPFLDPAPDLSGLPQPALFDAALQAATPVSSFTPVNFNDPLYILYSSGTTGAPKCIVHGVGGVTLQHAKELRLHSDVRPEDRLFFFTTCGWMMWNWLVSGLAAEATLLLYDGSPFYPDGNILFDFADAEGMTLFGTSAKYIDACNKAGLCPRDSHDLGTVRTMTSTGSPLVPEGFEYVYTQVKEDLCLASIAGGTDIVSCFVLGNPIGPVWRGEIQKRGLGMKVEVWDDEGRPMVGEKGELVCTAPFPSMPIMFWNDDDGAKYHAAYFAKFPNVWCHGDYVELTAHGGMIIYGRSDAVLNPGGVRIGTAEIYRQVERIDEVTEGLVIGQDWRGDVRVVLFVTLRPGLRLNDDLIARIKARIRAEASPRHVPAKILQVAEIPRTKSGKIVELAVRDLVHGRAIKNIEALANPEALDHFRDLEDLRG